MSFYPADLGRPRRENQPLRQLNTSARLEAPRRNRMDDDPLFPIDDLMRWQRGELPHAWFGIQCAIAHKRAERLKEEFESLRKINPELYARLSQPF